MDISLNLAIGVIGMILILGAFILVGNHKLSPDDLLYDLLNFIGSSLLVINATVGHAWPFVILNLVWGFYALKDVILDCKRDSKKIRRSIKHLTSPLVHKHRRLRTS